MHYYKYKIIYYKKVISSYYRKIKKKVISNIDEGSRDISRKIYIIIMYILI